MKVLWLCAALLLVVVGGWATLKHGAIVVELKESRLIDENTDAGPFSDVFYEKYRDWTTDSDSDGYAPSDPVSSGVLANPFAE